MNSAGSPVGGIVAFHGFAGSPSKLIGSVAQPDLQLNFSLSSIMYTVCPHSGCWRKIRCTCLASLPVRPGGDSGGVFSIDAAYCVPPFTDATVYDHSRARRRASPSSFAFAVTSAKVSLIFAAAALSGYFATTSAPICAAISRLPVARICS